MQKIKSERGITLLILIITIVVLALISIPIIVNTTDISELQRYTYFKGDIDKLRESIETTYADLDDLSSIGPIYTGDYSFLSYVQGSDQVANPNDGNVYYVISLSNLNSYMNAQISLKYGSGNKQKTYENNEYSGSDVYIINEQSRTIYYTSGVEYKGVTYYRLPENFTAQSQTLIVSYDANGGTDVPYMESVDLRGRTVVIGKAPTREGYTFKGYLDEATNAIYQPGDVYTVTQNTVFVAQWEEN